jgi:cell division septal protein FtsQ
MVLREGRRRSSRAPGIWRGSLAVEKRAQRPTVQHGARGRSLLGWRIFSALIVLGLIGVLFVFFSADAFYVHSIAVGGLQYLSKEEVFALTDIADMHIFWVDPEQVRQSILRSPSVADAEIQVGWPPNMVRIRIEERQPALIWEQAGQPVWIDLQGRVMLLREERSNLLQIVADNAQDGPLGPNVQLDADVVAGALQLRSLFPEITRLRYHSEKGLGYADGRGWDAWLGIGTDMPAKILVYEALVGNLLSRGIQPGEINVANRHAPYYSVIRGR